MSLFEKPPMPQVSSSRATRRRYTIIFAILAAIIILYSYIHTSGPSIRIKKLPSGYHIDWSKSDSPYAMDDLSDDSSRSRGKTSDFVKLQSEYQNPNVAASQKYTTTIVLGRREKELERVQWLDDLTGITNRVVYIVDQTQTDEPHLKRNHGREAMVYLLYIIDNYDSLNDITFFWHSDKKVWHNNILLGEDSVQTINRMDREYIMKQGYVPSRCDHWPGCPSWIKFDPSQAEHQLDEHRLADMFSTSTFTRLFPEEYDYPRYFAETCCSQFAVSREAIRSVPKAEYERLRDWVDEWFSDQYTGRALEMMWQYIFLRRGEFCPSMEECYCRTYGLCIDDKKELQMLERWNELRTRGEEYQWQEFLRIKTVKEENSPEESKDGSKDGAKEEAKSNKKQLSDEELDKIVEEDLERQRIQVKHDEMKKKAKEYKAMIIKHWNLPDSEVSW